ncbi:MAG: hypothetical protein OER90_19255, partial [Gemmatimonadota bacterium]|nr:hypothetical protein [Gemmatimonadota bacterium]
AASVGEALAAGPVVRRLRSAEPGLAVVHSYTSPSVTGRQPSFGRAYADYLPPDEPTPIRAVLDAVHPDLVVFSRGDLWPEFVRQCRLAQVPVAVVGAEVSPRSHRLSWAGRLLYARVLPSVSWIGAASDADAARWRRLGARPDAVVITGDPRHDAVLERIPELGTLGTLRTWAGEYPVLVGASLEPSDEPVVLRAVRTILAAHPDVHVLLVPHAVTPASVVRVRRLAAALGVDLEEWNHSEHTPTARCILITASGILFDLYQVASAAYVGGGFRHNTLHAVIEPAAYGLPIAVGPRYEASRDAAALVDAGGGVALPRRGVERVLAGTLQRWIADPDHRRSVGLTARSTVRAGAAAAAVAHLVRFTGAPTFDCIHHPRSHR